MSPCTFAPRVGAAAACRGTFAPFTFAREMALSTSLTTLFVLIMGIAIVGGLAGLLYAVHLHLSELMVWLRGDVAAAALFGALLVRPLGALALRAHDVPRPLLRQRPREARGDREGAPGLCGLRLRAFGAGGALAVHAGGVWVKTREPRP